MTRIRLTCCDCQQTKFSTEFSQQRIRGQMTGRRLPWCRACGVKRRAERRLTMKSQGDVRFCKARSINLSMSILGR